MRPPINCKTLLEEGGAVLNFKGVEVATSSFLDELLLRMKAVLSAHHATIVVVTGTNDDVGESLQLMLAKRGMLLTRLAAGQLELMGGKKQLNETLLAAQKMKTFKAADLAAELKIELPNLHQRLKALNEAGAIVREADETASRGRRYEFSAPDAKTVDPKKLKAKSLSLA